MPPPPAEPFAARVFLGPALRAQPDRRLVQLVREGYESAFEEIVRRYRKPLDRFAAAIVGGRCEDVTQDAFSKALLALRGTTTEIELKPWLYRIVRNTALNEIRDSPPPTEQLGEAIPGARSAAVEAERREEIGELMTRLRALPEPQRAAIVMRELEGLSHEEIAAALGVSGGAARQAIYRARVTLRDGFGLLIPMPLLRVLFDHGAEAAGAGAGGAAVAAGAASAAGGGAGATLGGLGAAGALKVGLATVVLAGSVGAGVAMQHDRGGRGLEPAEASVSETRLTADDGQGSSGASDGPGANQAPAVVAAGGRARGISGSGDKGRDRDSGERSGPGSGGGSDDDFDDSPGHGGSSGPRDSSGHGGRGSGHGGRSGPEDGSGEDAAGESHSGRGSSSGPGGGSGSGHGGSGTSGGSGDSHGGSSHSGGGEDHLSGSGDDGHGGDSGSSGGPAPTTTPPPPAEPTPEASDDSSSGGDSGSGGSGSGDDGSGGDELDS
jgi:RNA polymerase sigma factor (sigma-70 family)